MNTHPTDHSPRRNAAKILARWLRKGTFADHMLEDVQADRALVAELTYGTIRWFRTLEWVLQKFASRQPRPELEAYALIGLYQLLFMDDIPDYAVLNETVNDAKKDLRRGETSFLNAILRQALRAGVKHIHQQIARQPLDIRFSHPQLLVTRWSSTFGPKQAAALMIWNNTRPGITARVHTGHTDAETLMRNLRDAGINDAAPHPADPEHFISLPHGISIRELPGFAEGDFYIQDPSTRLAPALLDPQPGERLLDACAAPGGKTAMLAEAAGPEAMIVACEAAVPRVARLRENIARMKAEHVHILHGDVSAESFSSQLSEAGLPDQFDAVLLDVPCTNTGVIRRRPGVRWHFTTDRLQEACRMQQALIDGAARTVAPGGRLVYSTCSLEQEENMTHVQGWLDRHPDFELVDSCSSFPPESGTDGAFAALLQRTAGCTTA